MLMGTAQREKMGAATIAPHPPVSHLPDDVLSVTAFR
jgi:hypothetical protein